MSQCCNFLTQLFVWIDELMQNVLPRFSFHLSCSILLSSAETDKNNVWGFFLAWMRFPQAYLQVYLADSKRIKAKGCVMAALLGHKYHEVDQGQKENKILYCWSWKYQVPYLAVSPSFYRLYSAIAFSL